MKATLIVACLLLTAAQIYAGNIAQVVSFADRNWNCADVSCSSRVPDGTFQPTYECAEFVSRSLAAGGFVPGLGPFAAQSEYLNYHYGGVHYDLLWVSHRKGGPLGLEDFLKKMGWRQGGGVNAGTVLMLTGTEGPFSHTAIGISAGITDAHNMAHYHKPTSVYDAVDLVYQPPGK